MPVSFIIESTRRSLKLETLGNGVAANSTWLSLTAVRVDLHLPLTDLQQQLLPFSALWACHTLEPLPARSFTASRTECSALSSVFPSMTSLRLEEAPGSYLLRSFVATASDVVGPMNVRVGDLVDFPVSTQVSSMIQGEAAWDATLSQAQLFCQLMKDRIPQRPEGCAQKIVQQASNMAQTRLVAALNRAQETAPGAPALVLQHRLEFSPNLFDSARPRPPPLPLTVDETLWARASVPLLPCADPSRPHHDDDALTVEVLRQVAVTSSWSSMSSSAAGEGAGQAGPYRLLCLTYTIEPYHGDKVASITETWAAGCDGYLAMSNVTDPSVPALKLPLLGPES